MIARMSYVVCDECERHTECAEGAESAREVARSRGYVRRDGRDLCPQCALNETESEDAR